MKFLSESNFLEETSSSVPMLIEFHSSLCPPCMLMEDIMYSLESKIKNGRIQFAQVDVDICPKLEGAFKIEATPTFLVVKDGNIIGRHEGKLEESKLREFVCKAIITADQDR